MDNIRMDLLKIELDGMEWIGLVQDKENLRALVNAVIEFRVP
jgi:hypothetical protein